MPIGLSFQPGADQNGQQSQRTGTPSQEAVRLLSLRLPSVVGARAISPQALLQAPGQAGLPAGAGSGNALLEWLRRLLMSSGGQMPPQAMAQSGMGAQRDVGLQQPSGWTNPRIIPQQPPPEAPASAGPEPKPDTTFDLPAPFVPPVTDLPQGDVPREVYESPKSPFDTGWPEQVGGFNKYESDYYRG